MKKLREISQKYYSRKSKRIISLTKLTICTAVILSLAFTANLSASPTIFLDADTPATGSNLDTTLLTTSYGDITFDGEIQIISGDYNDVEFIAAGASGNAFNILDPGSTGSQTAELFFDFDVVSIEFIYGGNWGEINIEARDGLGDMLDFYYQDSTFTGEDAGPITLYGSGIRSLYWEDTVVFAGTPMDYAGLDNITITVIPSPSAVVLAGIGVSLVGWLRKRKIV